MPTCWYINKEGMLTNDPFIYESMNRWSAMICRSSSQRPHDVVSRRCQTLHLWIFFLTRKIAALRLQMRRMSGCMWNPTWHYAAKCDHWWRIPETDHIPNKCQKSKQRRFREVGQLKQSLMGLSRANSKNLPLKWHGYDVALHMLIEELKRYEEKNVSL